MDPRRLADVRAGTESKVHSSGTGYLIGERLVLTARHVVKGGRQPHQRIQVSIGHPSADSGLRGAAIVAWEGASDLVLLRLVGPGRPGLPPVRWGRFATSDPAPYTGLGYPRFADYDSGQGIEQLRGTLAPLSVGVDGTLVLDQAAVPEPHAHRQWSGVSGSAVFCAGLLVAVVAKDDESFANRRLYAVPAAWLLNDPAFRVLVAADQGATPVIEAVEFAADLAPPLLPSVARTPGTLLAEARQVVPFAERDDELAALVRWRDGPAEFAVLLIAAEAGQGKSRLAREFLERSGRDGWVAGRLPAEALLGDHRPARSLLDRLPATTCPVLIVVDYAENSAVAVHDMVARLARSGLPQPVRLLLLARSAGAWWDGLLELLPPDSAQLLRLPSLLVEMPLRRKAFATAVDSFCVALAGLPETSTDTVERTGWPGVAALVKRAADDLSDGRLANVLTLHTRALADVLAVVFGAPGAAVSAAPDDHLVAHERRYLRGLAAKRGLLERDVLSRRTDPDDRAVEVMSLLERALVATVLLMPSGRESLRMIVTALAPSRPDEIEGWLTALYPGEDETPVGRVQPDRLAEHMTGAVLLGQPDLLTAVGRITAEIDEPYTEFVTVLVLLRMMEHPQFGSLGPQIAGLLAATPGRYGLPMSILAPALGLEEVVLPGLVEWASSAPESFGVATVETALSLYNSAPLQVAARVIKLHILAFRRLDGDVRNASRDYYGTALLTYLELIARPGHSHEVLAVVDEANDVWTGPDGRDIPPAVGASIRNFQASALENLGRLSDALTASEQAVTLDRQSGRRSLLAMSLDNYAKRLAAANRLDEAIDAGKESYAIWQDLSAEPGTDYREQLSISLNNQATLLTMQGRSEEALEYARRCLDIARAMVEDDPAQGLPELRTAVMNYGVRLLALGRTSEAWEASAEAVELARTLVGVDEQLHLPDLGAALLNASTQLLELNRAAEAVSYADESMSIFADLADRNAGGYSYRWAAAASQLGKALATGERPQDAVAPLLIALALVEQMPEHDDADNILRHAVTGMRAAYVAAPDSVTEAFQSIFGRTVLPDWMTGS